MRTYNVEKRYGASSRDKMFLSDAKRSSRFSFFEFLISDEPAGVAGPDWVAEYLAAMRHKDGSYALYFGTTVADSAPDIHGTCHAIFSMKALGIEPPKEAIDYIERRKKDDGSFRLLPDSDQSDIDTTYNAVLSLRLSGRPVPKESADYAKSCRKDNGGYGLHSDYDGEGNLYWTRQALSVLAAAGEELSSTKRASTKNYILSKLREKSFGNIEICYDAVVSLDLMGSRLEADEKGMVLEQLENKSARSNEEGFKLLVIRKLLGQRDVGGRPESQGAAPNMHMDEAHYAVWLAKLEAYGR